MRQIKFRAWDGERMFTPGDGYTDTMVIRYTRGGLLSAVDLGNGDYDWEVNGYGWFDHNQAKPLTIQQFTGLIDKAGKEIYEGDIIRLSYCGNDKPEDFTVKWNEPTVRFILLDKQGHEWSYGDRNDVMVVGNIHEHPQLLQP